MENLTPIVLQIAILGLVTLVGSVFTYALPAPSQRHKASSGLYARWFLFSLWLGYLFLCLCFLGVHWLHALGYQLCMVSAAYLVLTTVLKRHGCAVGAHRKRLIGAHLVLVEVLSVAGWALDWPALIADATLAISVLIPLVLAARLKYKLMDRRNLGDRLLFRLLVGVGLGLCIAMPVYMLGMTPPPAQQALYAFGTIVVLELLFMLGFVVSVIHSLVIRLRRQIYKDPLTGCKNRHYLHDYAQDIVQRTHQLKQPLCMLVCDIDHFKQVNDAYGHQIGDKALHHFSQQLYSGLRKEDVLIRMGGEEFLMLLPGSTLAQAHSLAERLRQQIAQSALCADGQTVFLTASFGLVPMLPQDDLCACMKAADDVLYRAKHQGRNRVVSAHQGLQPIDNSISMAFQ